MIDDTHSKKKKKSVNHELVAITMYNELNLKEVV